VIGILVVDKPSGWTSHDVVGKIRSHFELDKVGHAGTLDPNATGVLVLAVGAATRFIRFLPTDPKEYEAEMILGVRTDTLDITGQVLSEKSSSLDLEELESAFAEFSGEICQVPPMFSAVKSGGKPLHRLARRGEEIKREPRKVHIFDLRILKVIADEHQKVLFSVTCSKGTYVRTLCEDIGNRLGPGACLGRLVRVRSGDFALRDAHKLSGIVELSKEEFAKIPLPLNEALVKYNLVAVKDEFRALVLSGGSINYSMVAPGVGSIGKDETVRIIDNGRNLLGLAKAQIGFSADVSVDPKQIILRPVCILSHKND